MNLVQLLALATSDFLSNQCENEKRRFELAVMVAILLNMVVMAIESHDANDKVLFILEQLNNVFVGVFGAEVILKLIGLRQHYFTVPWNVFDLVVVVVSVVASALSDLISHFVQPTIFRIVRLFRVTRVLRLIREAKVFSTCKDMDSLLLRVFEHFYSLLWCHCLPFSILDLFWFWSCSCMQYLACRSLLTCRKWVELTTCSTSKHSRIRFYFYSKVSPHFWHQTFVCLRDTLVAIWWHLWFLEMTLGYFYCQSIAVRNATSASTSENWNTFLEPIMLDKPPYCDPNVDNSNPVKGKGNCGNRTIGTMYFISFVIITFLIVVNMYIARDTK